MSEPLPDTLKPCAVCQHSGPHSTCHAREMMFGTRDVFTYFTCAGCGVLQIRDIPNDLSRYYPADYYAHQSPTVKTGLGLRRITRRLRLYLSHWLGIRGLSPLSDTYAWVEQAGVNPGARILDVGCGAGHLLLKLHELGFTRLEGADPYLSSDLKYANSVMIQKRHLQELTGEYDLVMSHHSYEHMPDPVGALREMARLCAPGGTVLIRVPLTGTYAWRVYGTDWVQLDAPRHFFLFTEAGMEKLAGQAGLTVQRVVYDSHGFQIWGSEQYKRGFSLDGPGKPTAPLFSPEELCGFEEQAVALNARKDGDQACFLLRKPKHHAQ